MKNGVTLKLLWTLSRFFKGFWRIIQWVIIMAISKRKLLCNFLNQVEEKLCKYLEQETSRFVGAEKLINVKFRERRPTWENSDLEFINEVTETTNEIVVAYMILTDKTSKCKKLEYEPKPDLHSRSIDYRATFENGYTIYVDVKTIHPGSQDDWDNFISIKKKGYFPENVEVILSKNGLTEYAPVFVGT